MTPGNIIQKPFAVAVRERLDELGMSQRALHRRAEEEAGTPSLGHISALLTGKQRPIPEKIEVIARLLRLPPDYFAEYRLAVARDRLDPEKVGLKRALLNLGEKVSPSTS